MSIGVRFFGAGALLLILFLGIGFLLPGRWAIEREHTIAATPAEIVPYLDSPTGWEAWVPWPEAGAALSGPERGEGATRSWDDAEWGDGVFTIVRVEGDRRVEYEVTVEEGTMRTRGSLTLTPVQGGTRVVWEETGDFGRNPLMGWMARLMDKVQGRELERSLIRLEELLVAPTAAGAG